jgi:hypothetical protein
MVTDEPYVRQRQTRKTCLKVGIVEERAAGTGDVLDLALDHPTC